MRIAEGSLSTRNVMNATQETFWTIFGADLRLSVTILSVLATHFFYFMEFFSLNNGRYEDKNVAILNRSWNITFFFKVHFTYAKDILWSINGKNLLEILLRSLPFVGIFVLFNGSIFIMYGFIELLHGSWYFEYWFNYHLFMGSFWFFI